MDKNWFQFAFFRGRLSGKPEIELCEILVIVRIRIMVSIELEDCDRNILF